MKNIKRTLTTLFAALILIVSTALPSFATKNTTQNIWTDKYGNQFYVPNLAAYNEFPTKDGLELMKSDFMSIYMKTMKPGQTVKQAVNQLIPNCVSIDIDEFYIGDDAITVTAEGYDSNNNYITVVGSIRGVKKGSVTEYSKYDKFYVTKIVGPQNILEYDNYKQVFSFIDLTTGMAQYYEPHQQKSATYEDLEMKDIERRIIEQEVINESEPVNIDYRRAKPEVQDLDGI